MLSRVKFRNFKALADVDLELERLTVLVGANATGKTTVLEGIDAMCQLARPVELGERATERLFSGRLSLQDLPAGCPIDQVSVELSGPHPLRLTFERNDVFGHTPIVSLTADGDPWRYLLGAPFGELRTFQGLIERLSFPSATRTAFDLGKLGGPSYAIEEQPRLGADGSGLSSVLAELLVNRSSSVDRIQDELRRLIPLARRLRTPTATIRREENEVIVINGQSITNKVERTHRGHRLELELEGIGFLPAQMLSEGTLILIGLLTLLHTSKRPHVFLLDDLDRGLHPKAQRVVVDALRRFTEENPEVQIVCTTHSPYALDCFRPEEVRVMKLDKRGRAHCRELTEHPEWERWKDHMQAGEFWSSVGEDWVFGEDNAG